VEFLPGRLQFYGNMLYITDVVTCRGRSIDELKTVLAAEREDENGGRSGRSIDELKTALADSAEEYCALYNNERN
jgi:hypothetical protein